MAEPELSIVVVSYNTRDLLARCLRSVGPGAGRTSHEIVVVDNASEDGSTELLAREFPRVRSIVNSANVGFARAVNQGIRAGRSAVVLLLNSDAEATPGSLEALTGFLRARPRVAAAGPRLVLPDGRAANSCFRFPSLVRPYLNFPAVARFAGHAFDLSYPPGSPVLSDGGPVDWLSGACLALRRKALDHVGLLDEGYFMYFEDTDLCRRLSARGWLVWYWPLTRVFHAVGQSARREPERLWVELRRSTLHYFQTHHPGPVAWAVRALMLAAAMARLGAERWHGGPRVRAERQIIWLALGAARISGDGETSSQR